MKKKRTSNIYKRNIILVAASFVFLISYVLLVNWGTSLNYNLSEQESSLSQVNNEITSLAVNTQSLESPSYVYNQIGNLDLTSIKNPQYMEAQESLSMLSYK